MKVAVIRKECGLFKGGAERYCMALCIEMATQGHQVYLLSNRCEGTMHENIEYVQVPVSTMTSSSKNLSFHVNCQKILKSIRADWVYALSRTFPVDAFRVSDPLHARWMKIRYRKSFLEKLQRLNPRHRTILFLEQNIFSEKNTRMIITNSELAKSHVLEEYNFPRDRIHVVYNGVDLKKFSPGPATLRKRYVLNSDEMLLLFVAMDFKRKGLDFLLSALAELKERHLKFKLLVVGKDKEGTFLRNTRKLSLNDNVVFVGETSTIEDYYRAADIFVLPTRYDPFANVCLEAMACGTPVITTMNNGASELITNTEEGYVIENSEKLARDLQDTIFQFSRLPEAKRNEMHEKARLKAEKFSINRNISRTVDLFESEAKKRYDKHTNN